MPIQMCDSCKKLHYVPGDCPVTVSTMTVEKVGAGDTPAAAPAPLTVRGTPRQRAPKGTFDRKAYQREAAKERRAKVKT